MTAHDRKPYPTLVAYDPEALATLVEQLARIERKLEQVDLTPKPQWVPVKELAARLGRSPRTVTRMIERGEIESQYIGNVRMVRSI